MPVRECSSGHCSVSDPLLHIICHENELDVGTPVLTEDETGPCVCRCSCLAFGTMVQSGDNSYKAIESYLVGDTVLTAGTDLNWSESKVVYSNGTPSATKQRDTVLVIYNGTALASTADHLYLTKDRTLKRADRLTPDDVLVAPDGTDVPITSVHLGEYYSGFHHIATTKERPPEDLTGHLLNTNGVISADYAAQLFARQNEVAGFDATTVEALPEIGSPEYLDQHGDACLKAPELPAGFTDNSTLTVKGFSTPDLMPGTFVSANDSISRIPDTACSFISAEEAAAKARDPRRAFNDPNARGWAEELIRLHEAFFPDVTYHLDWADNDVNAYAWVENNGRHVSLKGGLVRHRALELEGLAIILAHELSHHYGGDPTFPEGLSCEGQADYHGTLVTMRRVWFGDSYSDTTSAGITQMADFFGVPDDAEAPGGSANCNHPEGRCRVATYRAGVRLQLKPDCSV
jgi:hypothetical protein